MIVFDLVGPIRAYLAFPYTGGIPGPLLALALAITAVVIAAGISVSDRW